MSAYDIKKNIVFGRIRLFDSRQTKMYDIDG